MDVTIDGARIFYLPVGSPERYPLIMLHGGPGLDHTELHPWLDALADTFYLIYVDQRGQGRSERVNPATLTLGRFAEDVTKLARALGFFNHAQRQPVFYRPERVERFNLHVKIHIRRSQPVDLHYRCVANRLRDARELSHAYSSSQNLVDQNTTAQADGRSKNGAPAD